MLSQTVTRQLPGTFPYLTWSKQIMATITEIPLKTGGCSYKAIIKKHGKILTTRRWPTRKAATAWAKRVENDEAMLEALDSGLATMSFKKLAKEYLDWWHTQNRGDKGVPARVKWWSDRLGSIKLVDIKARHIRNELDIYAEGRAKRGNGPRKSKETTRPRTAATVNRHKAGLSAIFKFAKGKGYVTVNPVSAVASRPENNKRVRWLSDEEREALLTACKASEWDRLHLLAIMGITTGCRLGESLGLQWSDIDFKNRTAHLATTKNGESRVLSLPAITIATLTPFREVGDGLVFPGLKYPDKPFEFRPFWDKALVDAGITNFRYHDTRHSCASYLAMNGCTLLEIAEVLGHKNLETTKRYSHLSIGHKQSITDKVMRQVFDE